ncbi:MAG: SGNH/GDSL hydrolase family protein [Chloroflexi bacterium]|nr:MAG: SGNH/GDSL hydrolase family protein [Chloroflexota bacterium]
MKVVVVVLGVLGGVLLLEAGLRLVPASMLDALVERTSQRLALYRLDPRLGWSLQPDGTTVITTKDSRAIPIQINSLGLRDTEHSYEKPPGTYRLLMLGDSFTEALDVYLKESFPYRVEQCLNGKLSAPVEVINGGVSGYGPWEEYLFYQNEGAKYNPDVVVWVIYVGNDFVNLRRTTDSRLAAGFGAYRLELQDDKIVSSWMSWDEPYPQNVNSLELFLRQHSRLWRVLFYPESKIRQMLVGTRKNILPISPVLEENDAGWDIYLHTRNFTNNDALPFELKQVWQLFEAIAVEMHRTVQADGRRLMVVIIPADYQVSNEKRMDLVRQIDSGEIAFPDIGVLVDWVYDEPNATIARFFEARQVPVLDMFPHFQRHYLDGGGPLYFEGLESHLNKDGQRLMGDVMCEWLGRNGLLLLPGEVNNP